MPHLSCLLVEEPSAPFVFLSSVVGGAAVSCGGGRHGAELQLQGVVTGEAMARGGGVWGAAGRCTARERTGLFGLLRPAA
jgi:hypothetical protein